MISHVAYLFAGGLILGVFALLYSMKNKKLKRGIVLTLLCAFIVYMAITFGPKQSERPFRQSVENVVSVVIRTGQKYNPKTEEYETVLKELPAVEGVELICTLKEQEIEFIYFSPYLELEPYLEIYYMDGEVEQLCWHNNFWITPDGETRSGGYQFADSNELKEILEQYYEE